MVCNKAAAFNICIKKVQDEVQGNLKLLFGYLGKEKSSQKAEKALNELKELTGLVLAGLATTVDTISPSKPTGPDTRMAKISHHRLRTKARLCPHGEVVATEPATPVVGIGDLVLPSMIVALLEERTNKNK